MEEDKVKQNKKFIYSLTAIVVLLLVGYSVYYIWYMNTDSYKQEQNTKRLDQLEKSSIPVAKTPSEKAKDLEALNKSSDPVKYTEEEKLKMLQSLSE